MYKSVIFSFLIILINIASAQCPTIAPTNHDSCNLGPGSVQLGASGSTGYYNWYDAASGGTYLGSGAQYNTPYISATTNYYVTATDTPSALTFDGTNDYVALNMSYNGRINSMTVEAWVKTTVSGVAAFDNWSIVDFDRSEYFNLFTRGDNGTVGFGTADSLGNIHDLYSSIAVNDGNWHHIAAVYDGTDKIIYIDGVEVARAVNVYNGFPLGTAITRYGFLGDGSEASSFNGARNNNYYQGSIDEVRIWNIVRSAAQINNNKDICLSGAEAGLLAYYNFNEKTGTTLNDLTGNGNTGTLFNFNLSSAWDAGQQLSCPSCESPRTTVVATISGTGANLGPDQCLSGGSTILDAGPGFSSYNWNTGATTQTISVTTSGTYWVTVTNGSGCSDVDTIEVNFIASPTGTDGCNIGPGTVDLSVSGSSGYYNWYDAPTGGNLVNTGPNFTTPYLTSTTSYYVAAVDTTTSLTFDGVDDYVALNKAYTGNGQINTLTVEAWVKTPVSGAGTNDNWAIVDFDRSEYFTLFVTGNDGQVGFSTKDNSGTLDDFYSGSANTVNDNQWHHIAAVYDGTDKIIYIDGVEVARNVNAHNGLPLGTGTTRYGIIGDGSEASSFNGSRNNLYYQGAIDEVRIWNIVRSAAQINSNKDICLSGSESGLEAYYNFDEGSGSTLKDLTGNGFDGTLFNMLSSAWTAGCPITCAGCESPRTTVTANIYGSSLVDAQLSCATPSVTLDVGAGFSSYSWSTGATTQSINATQQGIYTVTVSGGPGGCSGSDTVSIVGFTASGNALTFDGVNDYVAIDKFSYSGQNYTAMTVECWINTTSGATQMISSFDRNQFWRLEIKGSGAGTGKIGFDVMTDAGQLDFGGNTRIDDGKWHHVAAVFDNGTVSIFIDGELDATTNFGTKFGSNATRYGFIGIGSEASTFNGSTGPSNRFNGKMDEFRIWSVARTQAEIRSAMCSHIPGNTSGLEVYYKFDEISGTTLNDYSTTTVSNGTLFNFSASPFATSGVPLGDTSTYLYTSSWSGQSLNLASCDGDNVTINNITGNPSGVHLYYVYNNPNTTSGLINYTSGNHYYGTFVANGTSPTYDITYSYPGHPLFQAGDDPDLVLFTRADNTVTNWLLSSSTVNTTTQEINLTSQSQEQFILDKYQVRWTGATNTDWAVGTNWSTGSVPPAGMSILIPNVTNQPVLDQDRTIGSLNIETGASVDLNGFNLSLEKNFINSGTLIPNSGALSFIGVADAQQIIANSPIDAFDLTINNANGVTVNNGAINLRGTLTLTSGLFTTNDSITLISDATGTARIGTITGGSISGDIIMQRYIDAGATDWRFLTSPVSGATLADWNDDFVTSGFPGSDWPNWPSASNPWPSIYFYDETKPGVQDSGFVAATNITNSIGVGQGVWVWSGDTITGTQPFTIDVKGPANTGTINIPLSYTNSGSPLDDGWNMAGNPYPSTLDWDSPNITKTNINNAIYIWNPDQQQFASYVGGTGFGTNGGSQYIASSQAFWVQANATGAAIQVTETAKSAVDANFLKQVNPGNPLVFTIQNNVSTDEMIINFENNATNGFDANYDAAKMYSASSNVPSISSIISNVEYAINQLPAQEISIPVKVTTGSSGLHTLNVSGVNAFNNYACVTLEDLFTGQIYDLTNTSSIMFYLSDTTQNPRFVLHIGAEMNIQSQDVACNGDSTGSIVFTKNSSSLFDADLYDTQNNLIATNINVINTANFYQLPAGNYTIISSDSVCGNRSDNIVISEPAAIQSNALISPSNNNDGAIDITITGGIPPYTYLWSNGAVTEDIYNLQPGTYSLMVIDANGCEFNETYTVGSTTGINEAQEETVLVVPNPSEGNINILIPENYVNSTIEIYTVEGKLMYETTLKAANNHLNLTQYPSGIYYFSIYSNEKLMINNGKLIISK